MVTRVWSPRTCQQCQLAAVRTDAGYTAALAALQRGVLDTGVLHVARVVGEDGRGVGQGYTAVLDGPPPDGQGLDQRGRGGRT
ncbi:hypothetical protein CD790_31120 [Streptomyces sp. SAJ15]|nr:hypothetical protein CD790_31120 [Streptomyces sp. SAJ15]